MPGIERVQSSTLVDCIWRVVLRVGFRCARVWWHIRRPRHEGALVAIYVGRDVLLLKSSYRAEWNFPGGSLHPGETPEVAARREMDEEIGLSSATLTPAGSANGVWDGRSDQVYFFELQLDRMPDLRLDNREIVGARLASPEELQGLALTGAVAAYLNARPRRP
jgi:8-oxo-dGTP pyrophosphatase MutT (NUDIX family)